MRSNPLLILLCACLGSAAAEEIRPAPAPQYEPPMPAPVQPAPVVPTPSPFDQPRTLTPDERTRDAAIRSDQQRRESAIDRDIRQRSERQRTDGTYGSSSYAPNPAGGSSR